MKFNVVATLEVDVPDNEYSAENDDQRMCGEEYDLRNVGPWQYLIDQVKPHTKKIDVKISK